MKVLWIGPYRDGTGYSNASINYILALDAAGVNVVPRPIRLNNNHTHLPAKLLELENKPSAGVDVVIQHILPHMMSYNGNIKHHIGLYASETDNFRACNWAERLALMDRVWVINHQMELAARASFVKNPIDVIPHAVNTDKFERSYSKLPLPGVEDGDFVFYTVCEVSRRKNLAALLKAFHSEFDISEPVQLVLKVNKSGANPADVRSSMEEMCHKIKFGLKICHPERIDFYHKKEVILTDNFTEEQLCSLHNTCNCYVAPSYGEAWGLPAMDAMGFGNPPIVTNWGGFTDYVDNKVGWLVNCHREQVFGMNESFTDLYTGEEYWAAVDIAHLRHCMREAYTNKELYSNKAAATVRKAYEFSLQNVGKHMKNVLESITCN